MPVRALPLLALLLVGCPATELISVPNLPGGNPLIPGQAALPFPSDLYTEPADTRTGRAVAIPQEVLPEGLSTSLLAGDDGFSRIPALLAFFPEGVDPASIPAEADATTSLATDAPIQVRRLRDGAPHPVMAELDLNARSAAEQALIIRPHRALDAGTTYVVAITDTLRSPTGAIPPNEAFVAIRDGVLTDNDALEAMRPDLDAALAQLEASGVARERLVLAWTFTTRSQEEVVGPLLSIQQAMLTADLPAPTVTEDETEGAKRVLRGTFSAPEFLGPDGTLVLDGDDAIQQGTRDVPFVVAIPAEVTEPRPVVLFGHGFFSDRNEATRGSFFDLMRRSRMSTAAIDFDGFSEADLPAAAQVFAGDLNGLPTILDAQVQNVATFTLLQRVITEHLATSIDGGGFSPLDGPVQYLGISNGGTQGLTAMATSPLLARGTLVVPGGGWTHMLQRATQWNEFGGLLESRYTPMELQLAVAYLQGAFDRADCLNYIDRLLTDRFAAAASDVQVSLHLAVHDSQVANLVTGWVARTADVPLIVPAPWDLPDHPTVDASTGYDGAAALFVYAEDVEPGPAGNLAPDTGNGTHDTLRDLESYQAQVDAFLQNGTLIQVCDDGCDPN